MRSPAFFLLVTICWNIPLWLVNDFGFFWFLFFNFFFLLIYDSHTEREREAETQAEGEAGSMQQGPDVGF